MIKKILFIACIIAVPTFANAFAPTKGNKKNSSSDIIEVVIRKKLEHVKKEIIDFIHLITRLYVVQIGLES